MFLPYHHIERFGTEETANIDLGLCFIFPKLDGTQVSAWMDKLGIQAGSRKRQLTLDQDNAGFYAWVLKQDNICQFLIDNPEYRLYGEYLIPHSLKTYRDEAWNKFYIFDVIHTERFLEHGHHLPYEKYIKILDGYNLDIIPPLEKTKTLTFDRLIQVAKSNTYLIKDGCGAGEGVVCKNYGFVNRFGKQIWAKYVLNEFKEKHQKTFGYNVWGKKQIENTIIEKYVTQYLVDKVFYKIKNEKGWSSKYIPELFSRVYRDLINEELWGIIQEYKNPNINFSLLHNYMVHKVKELKPEIF